MAELPVITRRSIQISGQSIGYQQSNADPEAFGAGIGRALAGFGQALGQTAALVQDKEDKEAASDVLSIYASAKDQLRERLFNPESGAYAQHGADAMGQTRDVGAFADEVMNEALAGIENPRAQAAFRRMWLAERDQTLDSLGMNELGEADAYRAGAAESTIGVAQLAAAQGFQDPATIAKSIADIRTAIAAQTRGMAPQVTQYAEQVAISGLHKSVIDSWMATDPVSAQEYFSAHKDEITGPDNVLISTALGPKLQEATARNNANGITGVGAAAHSVFPEPQPTVQGASAASTPALADQAQQAASTIDLTPAQIRLASAAIGDGLINEDMTDAALQEVFKSNPSIQVPYARMNFQKKLEQYHGDAEAALLALYEGDPAATKFLAEGRDYGALSDPAQSQERFRATVGDAVQFAPRNLLSFIASVESGQNGYNKIFGGRVVDLTSKTLDEVLAFQGTMGGESSAVGRYQFIQRTLRGLKRELGLTGNEVFNEELQDRLGQALLDRRGYQSWKSGQLSDEQFANNLAQEWAGLPMVSGPKAGRSYYSGVGSNASGTSPAEFLLVLRGAGRTESSFTTRTATTTTGATQQVAIANPGVSSPSDWVRAGMAISDPVVRGLTLDMIDTEIKRRQQVLDLESQEAKQSAWNTVIADGVSAIQPDILRQLDAPTLNSMYAYEENRAGGPAEETNDEAAWARFNLLSPQEKARMDIFTELAPILDQSHFDKAVEQQRQAADSLRGEPAALAAVAGQRTRTQIASNSLAALGIKDAAQIGAFQDRLDQEILSESARKGNKDLTSVEIQKLVDDLLIRDAIGNGFFGRNPLAFEAEDLSQFQAVATLEAIPEPVQAHMRNEFMKGYGVELTDDEAVSLYNRAFQVRLGERAIIEDDVDGRTQRAMAREHLGREPTQLELEDIYGRWLLRYLQPPE